MKNTILTILTLLLLNAGAFAQDTTQHQTFGLTLSGYIKTDVFYDTRQEVLGRERRI